MTANGTGATDSLLTDFRRAGLVVPSLTTLVALAILLALGTWQLQRKVWKEALLRDITQRAAQSPLDIGDQLFAAPPKPYTRVRLVGRFLHDKERFWFADGRLGSGFHVFTPFEMAQGNIVWVNRGYIPAALKNPATRTAAQVEGLISVVGLVREAGERNAFTPANDVAHNVWYWRDMTALSASAFTPEVKTAPVMVDLEAAPVDKDGWPQAGTALVSLPNRHLEYAVTWYGLAATLIGVFFAFARGRLRRF